MIFFDRIPARARIRVAFILVVVTSVVGAWFAAQQGGQAGANAAREEIESRSYEFDKRMHAAQIEACERGNILRSESNARIKAHRADTSVLREFLGAAKIARESTYEREGLRADLVAAQRYAELIVFLDEHVRFAKLATVDCAAAFPAPERP